MKHLGDITKINGAEIETVDVITGGSPCQDLSIAGKRAGLVGARSGLFMEQVRIVKEMREHDRKSGRTGDMVRPRFMVWENVPGAFSSNKGRDFAAVLEEIIRIAEPEAPDIEVPDKGWPTWGGYHDCMGGRWSVAWRVHDAQHWGVPQRRRRISIVADFGGDTAGEISFERKSVSGHPAPRGAAGKEVAGGFGTGADCAISVHLTQDPITSKEKAMCISPGSSRGQASCGVMCAAFKAGQGAKANGIGYAEECAPTLGAVSSGTNQCPSVLIFDRAQITSPDNHSTVGPDKPCPALQHTMQQYALDTLLITAHEDLGFGYDRCVKLAEKWSETFESFFPALSASDEADVYQEKLDRKLLSIMEGKREFHAFPERYPEVKRLGYGGRRG